ncbi:helix-turn-helix transcriptional regulator [Amycolatopsis pithecellobii]|uniref:Helix-turn-helix domain-containing protein n=1 Tax=Amycolatopsis pithecellobii TaxID=664692 RepID=A0A6N7YI74_9PSEU|nr:helix-turn-helix transcriptional regulator [Amycolatopsis pithecellobii]MTD52605.1 helix-turn-helix domain-containing protein [Amycolatopsis pithecellobii]
MSDPSRSGPEYARSALTAFLKARRARIAPESIGLPTAGRRRVAGLRREELAELAGVSVDYYVRLEQGRSPHVSDVVLEAVARALRLSAGETAHLKMLARPTERGDSADGAVREQLLRLLEATEAPAFILGRRTDVLAWNRPGDVVFGFSGQAKNDRNSARHVFTNPDAVAFYPDWSAVAAEIVAWLHLDAGRHPQDPELASLVGELSIASPEFRRLWARHDVYDRSSGSKRIQHPEAGILELQYEVLTMPGDPDLLITIMLATPGSSTEDSLRLLAGRHRQPPSPGGG